MTVTDSKMENKGDDRVLLEAILKVIEGKGLNQVAREYGMSSTVLSIAVRTYKLCLNRCLNSRLNTDVNSDTQVINQVNQLKTLDNLDNDLGVVNQEIPVYLEKTPSLNRCLNTPEEGLGLDWLVVVSILIIGVAIGVVLGRVSL